MLLLPAVITIEWEQALYEFDEGGNTTYEICAVTNDTITGDRIEERQVVFRDGSATGRPSSNHLCTCTLSYHNAEVS